ncbi:MAG: HigA family addiction module antidote protein [Muribaculaceae bacterium]|nr:HigA family addiction module antidote protein [Muribaculaceae bacterium]
MDKEIYKLTDDIFASNLIHPGEMIKDEIEERGITQKKLAEETGISVTVLNEVLNGKRAVTVEYALLLEAALGIDAEIWIRQQARYNKQKALTDQSFIKRLSKVRQIASVL